MFVPKPTRKQRRQINITQGSASNRGFKRGYQSFVTDSRTPLDALSDMTNVTLDQDNLPRPRESLVLHGIQPNGTLIGIDTFVKIVSGLPEKWDISMQVVGGVGKIYTRKDGGSWTLATGTNSYAQDKIVDFCQSGNRVYISNAYNDMSYFNISTGAIVTYASLTTPSTPTVTPTGLTGTNYTYYYRISANNEVGESTASIAGSSQVSTIRESWASATQYITLSWSSVVGATSYNIYVSSIAGSEKYLATVNGLTYKDDATTEPNVFKLAPNSNSTAGPKLSNMWNKDGQLLGVGDIDNPDFLWYDAGSDAVGDFSPLNGGGNVSINKGGDTVPSAVRSFRTGKGDSAITVLSSGVAGIGKMHHVIFTTTTFDNNVITIPNVQEATGQGGTVSARAVIELNNSLYYPTGQDFKGTGTSPNVQNILSTNSISNDILPDVRQLRLSAMKNSCGLAFEGKAYWSVPVNSDTNNQIWVKDFSRGGIWIMPWTISAKFMWLSENNTTGEVSFCIYDGTNILKFSRSVSTQDNGIAFRTRVAHEGLTWNDNGITMGAIQEQRFKLLQPAGTIQINAFGLGEDGAISTLGSSTFSQMASFTGWEQLFYSDGNSQYSADVDGIDFTTTQVNVTTLEIDETLNQLGWEIVTNNIGCDYYLSTVHTRGIEIPNSFYGD